jgi:hypothetical protein
MKAGSYPQNGPDPPVRPIFAMYKDLSLVIQMSALPDKVFEV